MTACYLFDWGDTLMRDDPQCAGKMRDWPQVSAIRGATELLASLSQNSVIYVASGAQHSGPEDIAAALARVGLERYINGYFCPATLGAGKDSPRFWQALIDQLEIEPGQITLVGDNVAKDIAPALAHGMQAVWFNPAGQAVPEPASGQLIVGFLEIRSLFELIGR